MIAPPTERLRILDAAVADPLSLARAVRSPETLSRAQVLKDDARSSTLLVPLPDGDVVVKTWALGRPKDRLNTLLRRTQAERNVRAAALLQRVGVQTAVPLLLFRGQGRQTLVMRALPGRSLLHHLDDIARRRPDALPFREQRLLAAAIGAQIQKLAGAGLFNRDHKPSNLIVMRDDAPPEVAVIDAVDIRRDRLRIGGLRMLVSLMLEPLGCACPPPRTMRMRTLIAATTDAKHPNGAPLSARKKVWRAVEQAIREHGDPTPRVNPLT